MKIYLVVVLLAFAKASVTDTKAKCVTIRGSRYEEEVLKNGTTIPYQLAIDHDTNTLFFSYTALNIDIFSLAYLNLKTKDYGIVRGIQAGFATAVDGRSDIVYMGGKDGIYTFNYDTKLATKIISDVNILQMFYKNELYFITYPDELPYIYKQQEVVRVSELIGKVMLLAVKNDDSFVFYNSSGLYTYSESDSTVNNVGKYTVNGFSADIDGNIYFSTPTGIFYINDETNEIEELAKLDNVYGVAIEANGNIIYASYDSVIRLKPTKKECLDDNILI